MRKLASIQRVWKLEPIEGADRIECASVLGWKCVVNKGVFHEGDLGVYFEIDSFLPIRPEFEFLRASSYKVNEILGEGFKLRTQKFRGQISQGLFLPISTFPELNSDIELGTNVANILHVRKWEEEERATTGGTVIGSLPYDVPHTDETRVQASPELIQEFGYAPYYISTKMDGSSHSLCVDENGFHVTGHNFEYKDDGKSSFYEYVKKHGIEERMVEYYKYIGANSLTIQGEFCAPGIQQNRLKLKVPEWYVFTILIDGKRLGLDGLINITTVLGLRTVPIEEVSDNFPTRYPTVDAVLARADGEFPNGCRKEGIVIRPCEPVISKVTNDYLSMKAVSNKYLLKTEGK